MISFPLLKTGAIVQYPATRKTTIPSWIGRFVDGSEQRFRLSASPLHSWGVALAKLSESEHIALREFFDAMGGNFGSFQFTDPWDSTTYPNCSLEAEPWASEYLSEDNTSTVLLIRENRS